MYAKRLKNFKFLLLLGGIAFFAPNGLILATETEEQDQNQEKSEKEELILKVKEFFEKYRVTAISSVVVIGIGVVGLIIRKRGQKRSNKPNSGTINHSQDLIPLDESKGKKVRKLEKLAFDSLEKRELDSAIKYFEQVLKVYDTIIDKSDKRYLMVIRNMGWVYAEQKNYDAAIKEYEKAFKIDQDSQKLPFLYAARWGNIQSLEKLKPQGNHVLVTDENGNNALHLASMYAPEGVGIEWLIDTAGISIESKGFEQQTPFLCAAEKGNFPALKLLYKRNANIKAKDEYGYSALHLLVDNFNIAIMEWLIDTVKFPIDFKGPYGRSSFLYAAETGNLNALKTLKKKGAKLGLLDADGVNALHLAAMYAPDGEVVSWLIKNAKIGVESKGSDGETSFLYAAEKGNVEALIALKKGKATLDVTDPFGHNALHLAAMYAPEGKAISWLINIAGIDKDSQGSDGKTSFLYAAEKGNIEALKVLQAEGANLVATDETSKNALDLAIQSSADQETITWLELECCFRKVH